MSTRGGCSARSRGWDELRFACEVLKGTQAEADREQMSKAYWHHCPPENARPRKRKPKIKNDEACRFEPTMMVRTAREFYLKKIPGWPIDDYDVDVLPHWVISSVNYPTLLNCSQLISPSSQLRRETTK